MKSKSILTTLFSILLFTLVFTAVFHTADSFAADANVRLGQTVNIPIRQPWLSVGGYNGNLRLDLFYDNNLIRVSYSGGSSLSVTALKPSSKDVKIEMYWACQKIWFQGLDSRYEDVDGSQSWTVHIITPDPPESISLPETRSLTLDASATLTPTQTPESSYAEYTWRSSAPNIVSVNNGRITALNPGEATITARSQNGLTASCIVTVPVPLPKLTSIFPKEGSTDMLNDSDILLTFDRNISEGSAFSSIVLSTGNPIATRGLVKIPYSATISGKQLKISPSKLTPGAFYTLAVPANALTNQFGKNNEKILLNFTVKTAEIDAAYPDNNSKSVNITDPIIIEYHADMKAGANIDKISLTEKSSGNSVAFSYSVSGTKLIITPKNALSYNTDYQFTIPKGALNNAYDIPFEEETIIKFTTSIAPLAVTSTTPHTNYGNPSIGSLSVHFNNEIKESLNFSSIKVTELESDKEIPVDLYIHKTVLLITPKYNLSPEKKYILTLPKGAVKNSADDENDPVTLYFTEEIPAPSIYQLDGNRIAIESFEGAKIYYTTDGSPAEEGKLYQSPISLPETDSFTLKAIAVIDGIKSSESSKLFTSLSSGAKLITTGYESTHSFYNDVMAVSDGYVAVGNNGNSAIIEKYDNNLNLLWSKKHNKLTRFGKVADLGNMYIVAGGYSDACVVAYDYSGNVIKELNLPGCSTPSGVTDTDYGFAVVAHKDSGTAVLAYDTDFEPMFAKSYQIGESDSPKDIISDGDCLVIAGETTGKNYSTGNYLSNKDAYIFKVDATGKLLWKDLKSYPGYNSYTDIIKSNESYMVSGSFESDSSWFFPKKELQSRAVIATYLPDGEMDNFEAIDAEHLISISENSTAYFVIEKSGTIISLSKETDFLSREELSRNTVAGDVILTSIAAKDSAFIVAGNVAAESFRNDSFPIFENANSVGSSDAFLYLSPISKEETSESIVQDAPSENTGVKELFILGKEKIEKTEKYEIFSIPHTDESINRWTSDPSIALFLPDGTVKPLKKGSVTLFATINNVTATKDITVTRDPYADKLVLTINSTEAKVFGKTAINDVAPIIENARTMLPARFVAENLGANVAWDGEKQKVTISNDVTTLTIYIGSNIAYINGEAKYLDSPAFIRDSRTYMPVRFICESLGASVEWDQSTQSAIISK